MNEQSNQTYGSSLQNTHCMQVLKKTLIPLGKKHNKPSVVAVAVVRKHVVQGCGWAFNMLGQKGLLLSVNMSYSETKVTLEF